MSNSSPRTMRRNAAISGSTSSNANSNVFGLTVPSLSARLLPWVRVTVLSLGADMGGFLIPSSPRRRGPIFQRPAWVAPWVPACAGTTAQQEFRFLSRTGGVRSHRRLRHARPRRERLLGGVLERLVRRQHHRGRAHPVVGRIDAGRRNALLDQRLGGAH